MIREKKSKRLKTFLIVSGMFNRHPLHYQELLLFGIPATEECSFRDLLADKLLSTFNPAQKKKKIKKAVRTQYRELRRPFDALNVSQQRGHSLSLWRISTVFAAVLARMPGKGRQTPGSV